MVNMSIHIRNRAQRRRDRIHLATPGRDDFLCGYAAALGAAWRLCHEDTIVAETLRADGLTLAHMKAAGVEKFDISALKKAGCK